MRRGDEQAQALEFVYTRLSTDPVLAALAGVDVAALPDRVWPDVAPGTAPEPFLVYSAAEALDWGSLGTEPRLGTVVPLNVRWVTRGPDPSAGAAAGRRLYELLHGAKDVPVSDGGMILTCRRTAALAYPEDAGGIEYFHTGGLFTAEVN